MKDKKIVFILALLALVAIESTFITAMAIKKVGCTKGGYANGADFGIHKKLADEYLNNGLYEQSIDMYEMYFKKGNLTEEKKANLSYIIGNIYMENLLDYKNAMASYIKAKTLWPSNPSISDINKKIVACLELMGRYVDAARETSKITDIKEQQAVDTGAPKENDIIVAKIGERAITMSDLDKELEKLPPIVRDSLKEGDKKLDFLQQYITEEALYNSAKRSGIDNEKIFIDMMSSLKKRLMADELYKREIVGKVNEPSQEDLRQYYEANKDKYTELKKDELGNETKRQLNFDEAKDIVKAGYVTEKQNEKFGVFIKDLIKAENVVIYNEVFKIKQ